MPPCISSVSWFVPYWLEMGTNPACLTPHILPVKCPHVSGAVLALWPTGGRIVLKPHPGEVLAVAGIHRNSKCTLKDVKPLAHVQPLPAVQSLHLENSF